MAPPPATLPEIAQQLERHPQLVRMKKMLICAWQEIWENDLDRLEAIALPDLIQSAIDKHPTLETLVQSLARIANTLNKKQEYQDIANTLIMHLEKLYPDAEEPTQLFTAPLTHHSTPQLQKPEITHEIRTGYDPFDLRLELMRYTNPLRAKILIFSSLQNRATLDEQDWANLKNQNLDTLLYSLYERCETFSQLENHLCQAANALEDKSENNQAAAAILQCLGRFYTPWEPGREDAVMAAQANRDRLPLTEITLPPSWEPHSGITQQESTHPILPS